MLPFDRRAFLAWLGTLPLVRRSAPGGTQQPVIDVRPTALFQQPDGRRNLVRVIVSGLSAPAARARVTDARGALIGTAGLLPSSDGVALSGELWVPLSQPSDFQVDVEIGKDRAARRRLRLSPPKRWTLYWLASIHTDVGYTDLQERALETHRKNLDAALARLASNRDFHFTAECALQVLSFLENRSADAGDALVQAIRDGRIGWQALFANMLTGLLDHETFARLTWPAGKLARERGLGFLSAQITDVPGQPLTFPMLLAASGVKYLASGPNPERAVPLLPASAGAEGTIYPQLYYWEGPDGSRVLHWRAHHYGDGTRFGFDAGPEEMGRRLSEWLLNQPALLAQNWPYDVALLYGADWQDNALMKEALVTNLQEFGRRFMWPRIVAGRAEDFFRDVERRYGTKIPVRRGDTGLYWEDGAASTAAELAAFRSAQLAARAVEIVELWGDRIARGEDDDARKRGGADARTTLWRDLLMFGEHTWGAAESIDAPTSRQTVAQWEYKKRFINAAAAGAGDLLRDGLLRLGRATRAGRGRLVFNAGTWERTDVARVAGGAGKTLAYEGRELASVDLDDGDALVLFRDVPPLGYIALTESDRSPQPPASDGGGDTLEATAGRFTVTLDGASGAIRSLTGPDGKERVKTSEWSGLNQLVYARGGARSALWTTGDRNDLKNAPQLDITQARFVRCRREKLPGIGVRLVIERALDGFPTIVSTVTLYDELPWVDVENRMTKTPTLAKEALYVAFPFAFTKPTVDVEVPLGRMTVDRDQQPGSCRDWYCHAHWVWLREGNDGLLWSAPDTPLFTVNDLFRGQWRRSSVPPPDGTLFAYAMNNYWHTNYAASQGGNVTLRFRISLLAPGDAAEPVRRGWAACDPLYVSPSYTNTTPGPLITKDRALFYADKNAMVVGAKLADDGEGVIVKLLDVSGQARAVGVWPAAYAFKLARRTTIVEQNGDPIAVGSDGRASIDLPAWGIGAARLFTSAEAS